MEFLEVSFKSHIRENEDSHNIRFGNKVINKVENFKYLLPVLQENERIVGDVKLSKSN